jgi:GT2 family glycosyltransferase
MDLSVVVVNYNTVDLLIQNLKYIYKYPSKKYNIETYVVDNNSFDDSIEMTNKLFPQVKILPQRKNLGFSKANNIAIKQAKGKYILLLNSDTVVVDDCLEKCLDYMEQNKDIGALGCKVILPDGSLDKACKRSFPTPKNSFYHAVGLAKLFPKNKRFGAYNLTYLDEDEIHEVDSLVGAFMMVKKEVIEQVGMLDEKYFMYGEDIDWCYRIKKAGWKIVYYPKAKIIHYKGSSSKKKRWKTIYEFHRAMYLFFNDHYKDKYNIIVTVLVYTGIAIKYILALLKNCLLVIRELFSFDKRKSKDSK